MLRAGLYAHATIITIMNIFFDARYIRTDFHDGISRYTTELGNALAKLTPITFIISDPAQLTFLPKKAKHVLIHHVTSVKEPFTAHILNKFQPDVVYSPMQVIGSMGRTFKLIVTSHDMIYFHHKKAPYGQPAIVRAGWRAYHATKLFERLALNKADIVATVSHAAQRQFQEAKLTKRPIIVIPNAPQAFSHHAELQRAEGAPRNLIYMGSFMPYKNIETLLKGMEYLPDYTLHILSKGPAARKRELEALVPAKRNVVFHGGVSDGVYAQLLTDKAALVNASLDEGFGLPVVEALSLGVPAVISDIPVFHEVAAGGALYFQPLDPKDFADQVKQLDSKAVRDRVISHGKTHAATFTWERSARTLLNAITSLR